MVIIILLFICATTLNLGMSHGKYTSTVSCNRKDQHLLSIFKQSIQDPSNLLSSWSNEEDCCNWIGVQCNNITGRVTKLHLSCPGNATKCTRITYLDLSFNDLRSQIPPTMLNLPHLKSLILTANNLNGSIPKWIGQFKHLEKLDLSHNSLSGPILATIGNLSSLKSLDVSYNHLNGSLPRSLGQLSKLEALGIWYNNLSGNLSEQSFTKLSNLKYLTIDSSALFFSFGTHWQPPFQLVEIQMSHCKFGPEFPSWLYTQKSVEYLDISSSGLSFNAQDEFWSFVTQIEYLYLSNNSISGDISTTVFNNTVVDLNSNKFIGRLPHLSPQVISFNIANSSFSGSNYPLLCQNVTGKQKLVVLDMSHNLLSGEFPDCWIWMHWQSLVHVNLGSNNLRGNIPSWITSLNMALILRSNKFNGSVPSQICQLSNLLVLDLADNRLSGPISNCINSFTTMVTNTLNDIFLIKLALMSTIKLDLLLSVKGLNSDYWNTFEFVRIVDLSSNDLSGSIPPQLFSLIAVQSLNLSHNHLVGKIVSEIGQMKNLESLDLSGNQLSGEIPQSLSNLSFLNHLNLSFNNFHGRMPLGTQLQSFEASSYIGNPVLCGPPLPNKCTQEDKPNGLIKSMEVKVGDFESSFKTGMGVGFASAFWGIFGTLLFIRKWRHAYFRFLDNLYIFIIVKMNSFHYEGH
ncbi:Leucine-rich repeat [Sesbania bispinosa]|nr:Leucine-rich repeat [Sesbania bispinosa]